MISEKLVGFLDDPVILEVGTRDGNLRPLFNRAKGIRVNAVTAGVFPDF
jgi:hypothetical protein